MESVYITLYSSPMPLLPSARAEGFYRARDLSVPSEFSLYELQLIPRLVEKTRAEQTFTGLLGEKHTLTKKKEKKREEF